jgi:hypothetical protein
MVMENAERRPGDSNVQQLLLDSASTIHIATTRDGMTNLKSCNKAVDVANKSQSYAREVGTQKFCMADQDQNLIVAMEDMHVLKGFMHDLVSLPLLLCKGCVVDVCNQDFICIKNLPNARTGDCMEFR